MVRKIIYSVATVLVAASLIWAANDPVEIEALRSMGR